MQNCKYLRRKRTRVSATNNSTNRKQRASSAPLLPSDSAPRATCFRIPPFRLVLPGVLDKNHSSHFSRPQATVASKPTTTHRLDPPIPLLFRSSTDLLVVEGEEDAGGVVSAARIRELLWWWEMRICELGDGDGGLAWHQEQQEEVQASGGGEFVRLKAKRALVGAGARVLFYPTLLYNVLRNHFEADFRWWDRVDQVLALSCSVLRGFCG